MNYMASCGTAGCKSFDATSGAVWFKVDEAGFENGEWAGAETLIKNNLKYSFTIPSNIPDGEVSRFNWIAALAMSNIMLLLVVSYPTRDPCSAFDW